MKKIIQLTALFLVVGSFLVFETSTSEARFGAANTRIANDDQNGNAKRSNRSGNVNANRNSNINGNANRRDDDDGHRRGRRGRRGRGRD
jgi:hypothetical protein